MDTCGCGLLKQAKAGIERRDGLDFCRACNLPTVESVVKGPGLAATLPAGAVVAQHDTSSTGSAKLGGISVGDQMTELLAIFHGDEAHGPVSGELTWVGPPVEMDVDEPGVASVSYGPEGLLVVAPAPVCHLQMSLEDWSSDSLFVSGPVVFLPWGIADRIHTIEPDDSAELPTVTFCQGDSVLLGVRLSTDAATSIVEYTDEVLESSAGPLVWPQLLDGVGEAIRDILDEAGIAEMDEVVSGVQGRGWAVSYGVVSDMLYDPDFPAEQIGHVWFADASQLPGEGEGSELERDVLAALVRDPRDAADLLEHLRGIGWDETLTLDDVYDVLYNPDLPTWKFADGWFLADGSGAERWRGWQP